MVHVHSWICLGIPLSASGWHRHYLQDFWSGNFILTSMYFCSHTCRNNSPALCGMSCFLFTIYVLVLPGRLSIVSLENARLPGAEVKCSDLSTAINRLQPISVHDAKSYQLHYDSWLFENLTRPWWRHQASLTDMWPDPSRTSSQMRGLASLVIIEQISWMHSFNIEIGGNPSVKTLPAYHIFSQWHRHHQSWKTL